MKKKILALMCLLFLLAGCENSPASNTPESKAKTAYTSRISKEDCALCNYDMGSELSYYAEQKNVGIICINTFDIAPVTINRYDESGNLIEEPSETFSIGHTGSEEGKMQAHVYPNTDRGYANVDVSLGDDESVDKNAVENQLCAECLSTIFDQNWDEPYGVGVIDFETLEVRMLEEKITGFTFGDYFIDIDHKEKEHQSDSIELDLLIFYCPPRYQ